MAEGSTADTGGSIIGPILRLAPVPTTTTNNKNPDDVNTDNTIATDATAANATGRPAPGKSAQTFHVGSPNAPGVNSQQSQRTLSTQGNGLPNKNSQQSSPVEANADSSPIDPLSQHIIRRTNTAKSIPSKLLGRASYEAEARGTDEPNLTKQGSRGDSAANQKPPKSKKKGVSFLSRIIGSKKKDKHQASEDEVSEPDVNRFDSDNISQHMGYIPRYPRPPKYIKVRAHFKNEKTFNRVFVAQELEGAGPLGSHAGKDESASSTDLPDGYDTGRAIWALGFSKDGKYLAAAGQDLKVRIWAVITSRADRPNSSPEEDENQDDREPPSLKAPVFKSKPIQVYEGHTGSILDLSWSKNNFLLSSSMDKTVRLWHVSRSECLCCFKHSDFVPSIQFHPRDDRFFLAGSLDMKLRLWSIPDKSVAYVATVPDMITSIAFTPDGRLSIAGGLHGSCNVYETDGLKLVGQLHVRPTRTRKVKATKITGIDTISLPPDDPNGVVKVLITSNDSRIRLYSLRDRTVEAKFRGNENTCSQIRATFSHDGKHIICGSEDRKTYVWPVDSADKDTERRAVEVLETQTAMVTAAVMAPPKTKQMLGFSEDPIYDICNPPPVTLVSSHEQDGNLVIDPVKSAQKSPTYLSRSTHPGGDIIIVADYSGKIKVLRQDCAYQKRRYETVGAASTISRKILRRSNSARHSIASSIGKDSAHKTPSERIISWRNSVIRNNNRPSTDGSRPGTRTRTPSPRAFSFSQSRRTSLIQRPESRCSVSPPQSDGRPSMDSRRSNEAAANAADKPAIPRIEQPTQETTQNSTHSDGENPLWSPDDQSSFFWNKMTHDALAASSKKLPNRLSVDNGIMSGGRKMSGSSALSSDYASSNVDKEEADDSEVLRCERCRADNFRATKGRDGRRRLVCVNCHTAIS